MISFTVPWIRGLIPQLALLEHVGARKVGDKVYIDVYNMDGFDAIEPVMIEYARNIGKNVVIFYSGEDIHGATLYTPDKAITIDLYAWAHGMEQIHGKVYYP